MTVHKSETDDGWLPIATAPRDKEVLFGWPDRWRTPTTGMYSHWIKGWINTCGEPFHKQPTHWRPLPPPPNG